MVRSAFGEWHVPQGFRVVWSAEPPGDLAVAMRAREAGDLSTAHVPGVHPVSPPLAPAQPSPAGMTPPVPKSARGNPERSPFLFDDFD